MPITESEPTLTEGDEAPDFELQGTDGRMYSLQEFDKYDVLLVVFMGHQCPYSWSKIPALNELSTEYADVAVVGVNPNPKRYRAEDSFEHMKNYVEDGTIQFDAYLNDDTQEAARAYGALCTPDPFLFANEDGTFRLAYHGRIDDALNPENKPSQHDMREAVDAVLAGQSVDKGFLPSRGCSIKWID